MFESLIKTLMQTRRPSEEAGRRFQSRLYFPGKREQPWKRIAELPRVSACARSPVSAGAGFVLPSRFRTFLHPGERKGPGEKPRG